MWHFDAAAALVSFSTISFEESFFVELKIVYWIFHTSHHQSISAASVKFDVM